MLFTQRNFSVLSIVPGSALPALLKLCLLFLFLSFTLLFSFIRTFLYELDQISEQQKRKKNIIVSLENHLRSFKKIIIKKRQKEKIIDVKIKKTSRRKLNRIRSLMNESVF